MKLAYQKINASSERKFLICLSMKIVIFDDFLLYFDHKCYWQQTISSLAMLKIIAMKFSTRNIDMSREQKNLIYVIDENRPFSSILRIFHCISSIYINGNEIFWILLCLKLSFSSILTIFTDLKMKYLEIYDKSIIKKIFSLSVYKVLHS